MHQRHRLASAAVGMPGTGPAGRSPSDRVNHPAAKWLLFFSALAALSCGGVSTAPDFGGPIDWGFPDYGVWSGDPVVGRAPLYRVAGGPDTGASGTLVIVEVPYVSKGYRGTERGHNYKVGAHLRGMTPHETYTVAQEVGGSFALAVPTDLRGNGSASAYVGHVKPSALYRVVVKDGGGRIVLVGIIPDPATKGTRTEEYEQPAGSIRLDVRVRVSTATGRESIKFDFSGFPADQGGELFVWQEGGPFASAGAIPINGHGRGALYWNSRRGAPLPGGAISVRRLSGVPFEVHVEGDVVITGNLP